MNQKQNQSHESEKENSSDEMQLTGKGGGQ